MSGGPIDSTNTTGPIRSIRANTLESFVAAFELQGYHVCDNSTHEPEVEKIAIFTRPSGEPTHAARQLGSGKWTSKLGPDEDIEHDRVEAVGGTLYGDVATVMGRPREPAPEGS